MVGWNKIEVFVFYFLRIVFMMFYGNLIWCDYIDCDFCCGEFLRYVFGLIDLVIFCSNIGVKG